MPTRRTPPLYARGLFTVAMPWTLTPATIYVNKAIRSFDDLYELEVDVFKEFYEPMGLTETQFNTDRDAKTAIITLASDDGTEFIYVPDTYIVSYPGMDDYKYSHIVMSVSLGPLPDYIDLTFAKQQIQNVVSDIIGATPDVNENRAPSKDAITPAAHAVLELARQSNMTLLETDYAKLKRIQEERDLLAGQVDSLTQILVDLGYFT